MDRDTALKVLYTQAFYGIWYRQRAQNAEHQNKILHGDWITIGTFVSLVDVDNSSLPSLGLTLSLCQPASVSSLFLSSFCISSLLSSFFQCTSAKIRTALLAWHERQSSAVLRDLILSTLLFLSLRICQSKAFTLLELDILLRRVFKVLFFFFFKWSKNQINLKF